MVLWLKSKWHILLALLCVGIISGFFFLRGAKDPQVKQAEDTSDIKQDVRRVDSAATSEPKKEAGAKIDIKKLPPKFRSLAKSLETFESDENIMKKMELEDKIRKADALIAKTDKLLYGEKVPETLHIPEKDSGAGEISDGNLLASRIDEVRKRLLAAKKKIPENE